MDAVVDTSTLISLSRSGLLALLADAPFTPVILDVVHQEAVTSGLVGGHPDAAAIESALQGRPVEPSDGDRGSADDRVLFAAAEIGVLIANDLALGRRARNLGAGWLRTADMVVWMVRDDRLPASAGTAAIVALRDAGRLTNELAERYLEEIE